MAKGIWSTASENDPIYKEGYKISSGNYSRAYAKSKANSAKKTEKTRGKLTDPTLESMRNNGSRANSGELP